MCVSVSERLSCEYFRVCMCPCAYVFASGCGCIQFIVWLRHQHLLNTKCDIQVPAFIENPLSVVQQQLVAAATSYATPGAQQPHVVAAGAPRAPPMARQHQAAAPRFPSADEQQVCVSACVCTCVRVCVRVCECE